MSEPLSPNLTLLTTRWEEKGVCIWGTLRPSAVGGGAAALLPAVTSRADVAGGRMQSLTGLPPSGLCFLLGHPLEPQCKLVLMITPRPHHQGQEISQQLTELSGERSPSSSLQPGRCSAGSNSCRIEPRRNPFAGLRSCSWSTSALSPRGRLELRSFNC